MFEQLSDKLEGIFKRLRGQAQLTEENVAETLREVPVFAIEHGQLGLIGAAAWHAARSPS